MQSDFYCDFTKRMRKATINVMFIHPSVRLSVACGTHGGELRCIEDFRMEA
jgi:hypothetical protein